MTLKNPNLSHMWGLFSWRSASIFTHCDHDSQISILLIAPVFFRSFQLWDIFCHLFLSSIPKRAFCQRAHPSLAIKSYSVLYTGCPTCHTLFKRAAITSAEIVTNCPPIKSAPWKYMLCTFTQMSTLNNLSPINNNNRPQFLCLEHLWSNILTLRMF